MKVIIIEDELPAQAKLEEMLRKLKPDATVMAKLGSVKESVQWLSQNGHPDLAFVDIQLSDDHSFEIFRKIVIDFPVIFTTAYDKYLMDSFEFNSIDYLLKPITEDRLQQSLNKIKKLEEHFLKGGLLKLINPTTQPSSRIVGRKGAEFIAVSMNEVAYFYTEHKVVFAREFSGRQLIIDKTMAELESIVPSKDFFRLNRKYLAQAKAIDRFKPDNGKIQIFLKPETKEEICVSKETAPTFREWIGDR
jgi:DNA-binding LytR/AlgR family response regulator